MLFFIRNRLNHRERYLFGASVAFLVSTAFIESIGYNNYSMRGMFLPAMVFYLFARHSSLLNVQPWKWQRQSWLCSRSPEFSKKRPTWDAQGKSVPPQLPTQSGDEYARLARDPSVTHYTPHKGDRHGLNKFNAEKLVDLPVSEMADAEFELLRRPKANFLS